MKKIAIATDSNSGLTPKKADELGIFVLPMPFFINDQLYTEGLTIKRADFFRLQNEGAHISTSQPSPQDLIDLWEKLLEEYESIIYIPMASTLSSSCATATALAQDYNGRVTVIDNRRISVTQKQSAMEAKAMADAGHSVEEIRNHLMYTQRDCMIYVTVDNLKYLKQGGRITPAVASVGTLLNLKPVLYIDGEKLDVFTTCRGLKAARKKMIAAIEADIPKRFRARSIDELNLHAACCLPTADALEWKEMLEKHFNTECHLERLPLSIATHVGFGTFGVGLTRKYEF